LMTFADRALGMAAWQEIGHQPQATIQLDVHFVKTVKIGEFVEAQCEVVRRTRSVVFMRGTLVVGSHLVATANGIWKILSRTEASPN
jgi:acyl-coenzyme A thioesterase PaaI-like protein